MTRDFAVEAEARERLVRIAKAAYGPFGESSLQQAVTLAIAIPAAIAVAFVTRNAILATSMSAAIVLAGTVAAWWWLRDPSARAAFDLLRDHDCHEADEWRTETGTKIPRTVYHARRWLEVHEGRPGTSAVLVRLGRLDEAKVALDAVEVKTPEDAFSVEVARRTIELYQGNRPDISDLPALWRTLPDTRERRHRRECLALLDAQIAVTQGANPWAVLAAARSEVDVHPSIRTWRFIATLGLFGGLIVAASAVIGAIVSGSFTVIG